MSIQKNIQTIENQISNGRTRLIAVTKTKPIEDLLEAYHGDFKVFGENKVQEMLEKYEILPKDIEWHMIGHLQSNKVKYIANFVSLIHSVDSLKLLTEIDKEAKKHNRIINVLLQMYIALEESKFGLSEEELIDLLNSETFKKLENIKIVGLMGMATNTSDTGIVRNEFRNLKNTFEKMKVEFPEIEWKEISMGMSGDYLIAVEEGSTLIRVGSAIFGGR